MSDPFLGEIRLVSWNYPPKGWAFCNGTLLPINRNTALFSLLGTTFGGDGRTTFALPDLRSRIPLGTAPTVQNGTMQGEEAHKLSVAETPPHTHSIVGTSSTGAAPIAPDSWLGSFTNGYGPAPTQSNLEPNSVTPAGGNVPHENRQPFLCLNFAIALTGVFPSRP